MIHYLKHYKTIETYAKACGVKNYTIADRAKHNRISITSIGKKKFVNAAMNPPTHFFQPQNKLSHEERSARADKFPQIPGGLIAVKELAAKLKIRADKIYELIIADKLDAWQLEGISFVKQEECMVHLKPKKP